MQNQIKFNIAKIYHKLGYDEKTDYLYLNVRYGLKAVKGDLTEPVAERIYYEGDIVKVDESWGITYPSSQWIPAPYVFDIVIWLKNNFNIIIEPILENQTWTYKIYFPELFLELELDKDLENEEITDKGLTSIYDNKFLTIEKLFEHVVNEIAITADKNNWYEKLNL